MWHMEQLERLESYYRGGDLPEGGEMGSTISTTTGDPDGGGDPQQPTESEHEQHQ